MNNESNFTHSEINAYSQSIMDKNTVSSLTVNCELQRRVSGLHLADRKMNIKTVCKNT